MQGNYYGLRFFHYYWYVESIPLYMPATHFDTPIFSIRGVIPADVVALCRAEWNSTTIQDDEVLLINVRKYFTLI